MCQKHSTDFFTDRVTLLMLVAALSIKLTIFRRAWKRYYECKICSTNIFLLKKEISQFAKPRFKVITDTWNVKSLHTAAPKQ